MRLPWVSRMAFDLVTEQCINLLEEKKYLLCKCEHMERALLRSTQTPEAQEYMRRVEPRVYDPNAKPEEPPPGSPWETFAQYYVDLESWTDQQKKVA
jgi:hypothetical protein